MAEEPVLNRDTALSLRPLSKTVFVTENQRRPWNSNLFQPFETPFLRIWDRYSGSRLDDENCMISRAPRQRLDTLESRKTSLTTHIDHKDWTPTPYISFTTSAAAIQELAGWRAQRRGAQTLTVVDPNARIADGLPILDVAAEMDHYGIPDPYGRSNQYYMDHYLCLWEVTEREIVGHWQWNDLRANEQWYHEIILPAFQEHGRKMVSRRLEEETLGLSAIMNGLSCTYLILGKSRTAQLTRQVISDTSDPKYLFYGDSDTSSEGSPGYFEGESCWSDTDDEAGGT
jgi:hypothetical protein